MSDEEQKDMHINTLRTKLDFIQMNIDRFALFVPIAYIRKYLTLWRECITIAKKHYPKAPTLSTEMNRFDLEAFLAMIITHPSSHQDLKDYIQRFKALLEFPQRYFENYDDMFPPVDNEGKQMLNEIGYRDFLLAEAHSEHRDIVGEPQGVDDQPNVDMEAKKFKKDYKKYIQEWKEKYD